jgi:membrane fusion protein, macrolide-specific efflux system
MKLFSSILGKIKSLVFSSKKRKIITLLLIIAVVFFGWRMLGGQKQQTVTYQTAQAQKGTLITSLTETGQVSVANKVSIVTQASGIINNVYVKSGDIVNQGDKIADITLDTAGQQRQAQAYSSLLSAQNSLASAKAQLNTLQSSLFVANQKFVNDRGVINPSTDQRNDPVYIEENATWLAAEAVYKNQSGVIAQSQANLNNANLTYQLTSGTIVAPTDGVVSDLMITKGMQVGSSNTTSGSSTTTSNQAIASIKTGNSTTVTVNIAEVDASKVQVAQKATLVFDAIDGKTFTGKVMGINTTGSVSSGVTTYPAVIQLDDISNSNILPNMSVTATIIINIKTDVLLIDATAIDTVNGNSTVHVLKNGKVSSVDVTIGDSNDTQTEITKGLSEGDAVITNYISASNPSQSNTTSSFSSTSRTSTSNKSSSGGMGGGMMGGPPGM